MKKLLDVIMFLFGIRGTETGKKYSNLGLIDYSGQGRGEEGGNDEKN